VRENSRERVDTCESGCSAGNAFKIRVYERGCMGQTKKKAKLAYFYEKWACITFPGMSNKAYQELGDTIKLAVVSGTLYY
jgi:hypothetical protein